MTCNKEKCESMGVAIPRDCVEYSCGHYESSRSPGCSTVELATDLRQVIAAAASMLERRGNPSRDEVAKNLREIGGKVFEELSR